MKEAEGVDEADELELVDVGEGWSGPVASQAIFGNASEFDALRMKMKTT